MARLHVADGRPHGRACRQTSRGRDGEEEMDQDAKVCTLRTQREKEREVFKEVDRHLYVCKPSDLIGRCLYTGIRVL